MRKILREARFILNWWNWYRAPKSWDGTKVTNVACENYLIRALRQDAMDNLLAREHFINELRRRVQIINERRDQMRWTGDEVDQLLDVIANTRLPR